MLLIEHEQDLLFIFVEDSELLGLRAATPHEFVADVFIIVKFYEFPVN